LGFIPSGKWFENTRRHALRTNPLEVPIQQRGGFVLYGQLNQSDPINFVLKRRSNPLCDFGAHPNARGAKQ
jgi:hypothetical protein